MAEITTSGSDADLSFEARWEKALGQPEVSIADAKKLTIDASPSAILARLREVADLSHAKGELSDQALASIQACSDQLEQAFTAVAPAKLQGIVGALKQRLRGGSK
jgi:hypothetical protein